MYCNYQDREELENDLYGEEEEDSDGSEVNSELEFHLYSQLHYASDTRRVNGEKREDVGERVTRVGAKPAESTPFRRKDRPQEQQAQQALEPRREDVLTVDHIKIGKISPRSMRLSARLEEVIVIDSGTDIVHSEDDNDEGVCSLKGQRSRTPPLQSSTPAQTTRATSPRSPSLDSVVVVDSGSESDDNSDVLESWMILGQGKDVEDHSISLNVEGQSGSGTDCDDPKNGRWSMSSKDQAAKIYNQDKNKSFRPPARRDSNRYYQDKNVTCRNCDKNGHLSKNCPSPTKVTSCMLCGTPGHMGSCCPSRHCNNCGLPGHLYEACNEKAYWFKKCHRCGMTGHFFDACPEIWRQYHLTTRRGHPQPSQAQDPGRTPAYCYNCSRKGHYGHACTQRRMFNGTYPSTPFINHYDTHSDFKQRDHRMKWKVKELQEAGLLQPSCTPPPTPGPPKKRPRTSSKSHAQREQADAPPPAPPAHRSGSGSGSSHIRFGDAGPDHSAPRRPAVVFKTKMSTKLKPPPVSGESKPWKPKREVRTAKPRPPVTAAAFAADALAAPRRHTVFQEEDFPRGGGKTQKAPNRSRSRKKNYNNRPNQSPASDRRAAPFKREAYTPEQLFGGGEGGKGKKARWKKNKAARAAGGGGGNAYPADENLFGIKQRKRKKK